MFGNTELSRWGWAGLMGASLVLVGCVEPPGAERIVGPDGTQMLHVHCADEQLACFQLAGERCPHGYDLSPIFDPHDGNFLVRCRDPLATPTQVARSATPATHAANESAADRWPPTEVARPSEPWPTTRSELPAAPRDAAGAVDIGY